MTKKVIVIGAGAGGLAVANLLSKAGHRVEVYESRNQLGGRMGLIERDGFKFDSGPSWYLMPEVYEHYFNLLSTTVRKHFTLQKLTPAYQVYLENETEPIIITGKEKTDSELFECREPGAGKALGKYLDSAEKTYNIAIESFLYTNFEKVTSFVKPSTSKHGPKMLKSALQPIDKFVTKFVRDLGLRQVLEYPTVFLGSSPFKAPALYHLMSYLDFRQGVFYPSGGMNSVTESLVNIGKNLGIKYHLNCPVKSILVENKQTSGILLDSGETIKSDIVISNADMHFTQTQLLPKYAKDYPESYWRKRTAGPSALLIYLGVKGKLPQLKHHNLFFAKDWKGNFDKIFKSKSWPTPASVYVCKPSETDNTVAPKGHENIFVLVPLPADALLHKKDYVKFADLYISQISKQTGIADLASRIVTKILYGPSNFKQDYNSWQGTALGLSHDLRQSAMFRPRTKSKKVENLYFVGANVRPGIGVPMCLISAELVYKQIIGDKSNGPLKGPIV